MMPAPSLFPPWNMKTIRQECSRYFGNLVLLLTNRERARVEEKGAIFEHVSIRTQEGEDC